MRWWWHFHRCAVSDPRANLGGGQTPYGRMQGIYRLLYKDAPKIRVGGRRMVVSEDSPEPELQPPHARGGLPVPHGLTPTLILTLTLTPIWCCWCSARGVRRPNQLGRRLDVLITSGKLVGVCVGLCLCDVRVCVCK